MDALVASLQEPGIILLLVKAVGGLTAHDEEPVIGVARDILPLISG